MDAGIKDWLHTKCWSGWWALLWVWRCSNPSPTERGQWQVAVFCHKTASGRHCVVAEESQNSTNGRATPWATPQHSCIELQSISSHPFHLIICTSQHPTLAVVQNPHICVWSSQWRASRRCLWITLSTSAVGCQSSEWLEFLADSQSTVLCESPMPNDCLYCCSRMTVCHQTKLRLRLSRCWCK